MSAPYYRLLMKDERVTRRHLRCLRKGIWKVTSRHWLWQVKDYLREKSHLRNIENEIEAITDAAFFRFSKPLRVEEILNDETNGNSTQKQVPRD